MFKLWVYPAFTGPNGPLFPKNFQGGERESGPEGPVSTGKMKVLKIYRDDCPDDPRDWDNLGTMVCWHRRYNLGDRHDFATPDDFQEWTKDEGLAVILPLYLYDHSGITISTEGWRYPYNDRWDSGQVGWIYVTKDRLRREYGVKRITKRIIRRAEDALRGEVETYDLYLRGEVYGFAVYETDGWTKIDSCGSFFGDNPVQNGMMDYIPEEFRDKLNGVRLRDGVVIVEDGKTFDDPREVRELINIVFPEGAEKYFAIRELVS